MPVRPVYLVAEQAYFDYFDALMDSWQRMPRVPIVRLTPRQGMEQIENLRAGGAVVTVHSVLPAVFDLLDSLMGAVPTLTLQDGIIEYRHATHGFRGRKRYRPLRTDYIAAFGKRSANLLMAMGVAADRICVTGSPRFDGYASISRQLPDGGYVLLTCANRPAFGKERLARFYDLFASVIAASQEHGIPVRVRMSRGTRSGGIEDIEHVADQVAAGTLEMMARIVDSTRPLAEDLAGARAVVTTPSTVSLEAMMLGRPVCHLLLDADCVMLNPPWSMRVNDDVVPILHELVQPTELKFAFQEMLLDENLAHRGHSAEKVVALLERIARAD